jgi:hypothetical protein
VQVRDQIFDLLFVLDAGEGHLGSAEADIPVRPPLESDGVPTVNNDLLARNV